MSPAEAPAEISARAALAAPHAGGSDAPELPRLRVGFMPLADCASLVMASVLQFDRKHGVQFVLSRQASWAAVRDKLLGGGLDLAHALYGMVYGIHLGVAGPRREMALLMTLNRNGQGLSLSRRLVERGATDLATLATLLRREPRDYAFAQTFPTGTHAMWLYYWLASAGIHPLRGLRSIVVPPAQMVAAARSGQMDGFSVGEPWNQLGILEGVSVQAAASQDIWPEHPEKALACTADFADRHPHSCRAAIAALLEAGRWLEAAPENRRAAAEIIAGDAYLATRTDAIAERLLGRYEDGLGRRWVDAHPMRFFGGGEVNFPYLSDGMWFMTQHKRWGLLGAHPDYAAVAARVQRIDLFRDAASLLQLALPGTTLRSSRLIDGRVWDGSDPRAYADSFALQLPAPAALPAGD